MTSVFLLFCFSSQVIEDLFKTATSTVLSRCPHEVEFFYKYVAPAQKVTDVTEKAAVLLSVSQHRQWTSFLLCCLVLAITRSFSLWFACFNEGQIGTNAEEQISNVSTIFLTEDISHAAALAPFYFFAFFPFSNQSVALNTLAEIPHLFNQSHLPMNSYSIPDHCFLCICFSSPLFFVFLNWKHSGKSYLTVACLKCLTRFGPGLMPPVRYLS